MKKKQCRIAIVLLCGFYLLIPARAQVTSGVMSSAAKWTRVQSAAGDFSIAIPEGFFVALDAQGFIASNSVGSRAVEYTNVRSLSSFRDGLAMYAESYKINEKDSKRALEYLIRLGPGADVTTSQLGSVENKQVVYSKPTYYVINYFVIGSAVYVIGAAAREANNPLFAEFLGSILINGKPIFNTHSTNPLETSSTVLLTDLQETPLEVFGNLNRIKEEKRKKAALSSSAVTAPPPAKDEGTKSLVILQKVPAMYTDDARKANEQGAVRLRISFLPNGHIGKITVVSALSYGLTESAIRAAKRMKFIPVEKNGIPEARELTLEYGFSIY